ncbi:MAG: hypothetical protein ACYDHY_17335 [Acidiferrobacterales bacterium]
MRARLLKPGLFLNERLAEVSPLGRLLFAALWCLADREGRLEDRPKRIKVEALPYDDTDIDTLLTELAVGGFIQRYEADGQRLILICKFTEHQHVNVHEPASTLPAPSTCKHVQARAIPPVIKAHVKAEAEVNSAPAAPVAAAAAPAQEPTPAKVPASETKPKAAPKPNKLSDVIDAIKDAGGEVTTSARDGKAVRECSAPAALIAEAYLAAASGAWGDDFTRRNLALWFVCSRIDGYRAHVQQTRASPGAGNGYESYDAGGGVLKVRQVNRFEAGTYGRLVQS